MHVVITGAGRGIGDALSRRYRDAGHQVTGTARDGSAQVALDVADAGQFGALSDYLGDGAVDLLVCNAGIYPDKGQSLEQGYGHEMWSETFAVNVTGVFLTVQSCLANLRRADGARIAIISSLMGSDARAPGGSYVYRASKAAALNLGRNLAADLKPEGIAVGIYHPGWVRTDMGGRMAAIGLDEAADGLVRRFDALSPATTGCFESWDGQTNPF